MERACGSARQLRRSCSFIAIVAVVVVVTLAIRQCAGSIMSFNVDHL